MEIPGSFNLAIEQNLLKQQAQQQTIWNGWYVIGEIALCSF
jgi:hypothetical protein